MEKSTPRVNPKARVLCLHGGGSSALIFKLQMRHITQGLQDLFEFIFPDAPFESTPGLGMLPFFDGCGPFYSWEMEGYDGNTASNRIREVIQSALATGSHSLGEKTGPFVGIMGFSEGASLVAGLLKQQSFEVTKGNISKQEGNFDFGILFSPVCFLGSPSLLFDQTASVQREFEEHKVDVPSLHIYGLSDPALHLVRRVFHGFTEKKRAATELKMSHALPSRPSDIQQVVGDIKKLWCHVSEGVALQNSVQINTQKE